MRTKWMRTTASQVKLERRAQQQAAHSPCTTSSLMTTLISTIARRTTCIESVRTAHLFHSCDCLTLHIPWLKFWAHSHFHLHGHPWRTLFDSLLPFYFHLFLLSIPVFLFHLELFLELHYTIVMANLRCSAAEERGHPELRHLSHKNGETVMVGPCDPLFVPTRSLMKTPTLSTDDLAQEDLL